MALSMKYLALLMVLLVSAVVTDDLRRKEDDLRRKEDDLRRKEDDLRDLRRKEDDLRKATQDLRGRDDARRGFGDMERRREEQGNPVSVPKTGAIRE